jgi:hypothetical protein
VSLPDTVQLVLALLNNEEYRRATICTKLKVNVLDVKRCMGERAATLAARSVVQEPGHAVRTADKPRTRRGRAAHAPRYAGAPRSRQPKPHRAGAMLCKDRGWAGRAARGRLRRGCGRAEPRQDATLGPRHHAPWAGGRAVPRAARAPCRAAPRAASTPRREETTRARAELGRRGRAARAGRAGRGRTSAGERAQAGTSVPGPRRAGRTEPRTGRGGAHAQNARRRSCAGPSQGRHAARGGEGRVRQAGYRVGGRLRPRRAERGRARGERAGPPRHGAPRGGRDRGRRGGGGEEEGDGAEGTRKGRWGELTTVLGRRGDGRCQGTRAAISGGESVVERREREMRIVGEGS